MKIPVSIKEAIEILYEMFEISSKNEQIFIKNMKNVSDMIAYHSTVGRKIRNNWGFWEPYKTPLKEELFKAGCGNHPDDMSMFILNIFYYHIKNKEKPIDIIINEYIIKNLLE